MQHCAPTMKSTILIFCLTLLASQLTEATIDTAVLDLSGDEVQPGVDYYIVSTFRPGGGLTMGLRNFTCPLIVTQAWHQDGDPVRFYPVDPEAKVVTLNKDMNVAFSGISAYCRQTKVVWKMLIDEATGNAYVGTAGEIGKPGPLTFDNWFKIVKEERTGDYKFMFCPDVDPSGRIICGDLGFLFENEKRWLGLLGSPFGFILRKA